MLIQKDTVQATQTTPSKNSVPEKKEEEEEEETSPQH
jgi:hypothetical protein